jgi:hypothetical protein
LLAQAGVSEAVRVKLARHSEWKQTDQYTDPQSLQLFIEIEKLNPQALAPILAPKSGKRCPEEGKLGNNPASGSEAEIVAIDDGRIDLGKAVPSWKNGTDGTQGDSNLRLPDNRKASWSVL